MPVSEYTRVTRLRWERKKFENKNYITSCINNKVDKFMTRVDLVSLVEELFLMSPLAVFLWPYPVTFSPSVIQNTTWEEGVLVRVTYAVNSSGTVPKDKHQRRVNEWGHSRMVTVSASSVEGRWSRVGHT